MNKDTLRIAYWNANSLTDKKHELTIFLENYKIDVMLHQETFLKPSRSFNIQNYVTYRSDRLTGPRGGTAILVHKTINNNQLPIVSNVSIEHTGIAVSTAKGILNIYSVYLPPGDLLNTAELINLFSTTHATIAAGDLNAKHTEWNSTKSNVRGNRLKSFAEANQIIVTAPNEPTHVHEPTGSTDVLDIALLKDIPWNFRMQTLMELTSDHCPVLLEIDINPDTSQQTWKKVNWSKFKETIETKHLSITTPAQLEQAVSDLEQRIVEAERAATTTYQGSKKHPPANIAVVIAEKRKAKKDYCKRPTPANKQKLNRLTNLVKMELKITLMRYGRKKYLP